MSDLQQLFTAQSELRRWRAERENASARVDLAKINEVCARLLSAHEPIASLGMNRDHLRALLAYIHHGDESRLDRELSALSE